LKDPANTKKGKALADKSSPLARVAAATETFEFNVNKTYEGPLRKIRRKAAREEPFTAHEAEL
jgi:hypothetical protein